MVRGTFITLEGGEGTGKSTQAKRLAEFLRGKGHDVVLTREVGGCPSAEEIRDLWLVKGEDYWDALTELVLITAARREHVVKIIRPALEQGKWVVCDRFVDSTRAYQGMGLKMGIEVVDQFTRLIAPDLEPDLTFLLDMSVEAGLGRMASRRGPDDRYQKKDKVFHQTLRDAYLDLAKKYGWRFAIVDASHSVESVAMDIQKIILNRALA